MNDTGSEDVQSATSTPVTRHQRLWSVPVTSTAIVIVLTVLGLASWQLYKIRKDISALQWADALHYHDDDSVITPDPGTIQFLKKGGYSVTLSTAKYTGDGLLLIGNIGNPTHLTITNLSIKIVATKQLYQYQDDYEKDSFGFVFGPPSIGEAQSSPISYLGPGLTAPFEVTIPNVKQTKEGARLVVSFSGERYAY